MKKRIYPRHRFLLVQIARGLGMTASELIAAASKDPGRFVVHAQNFCENHSGNPEYDEALARLLHSVITNAEAQILTGRGYHYFIDSSDLADALPLSISPLQNCDGNS